MQPTAAISPLGARSIDEFVTYAARCLAWPFIDYPWLALVMWMPAALLALQVLWTRDYRPVHGYLAALGLWVIGHALAAALARGGEGIGPSWRYMDVLAIGTVVNGLAAALLLDVGHPGVRRAALAGGLIWAVLLIVGVDALARRALVLEAPNRHNWTSAYTRNIRQFIADGDVARFAGLSFPDQVPWPDPRALAERWLQNDSLRAVLPWAIRAPLPMVPAAPAAFSAPGTYPTTPPLPSGTSIGSYGAGGNAVEGQFKSQPLRCVTGSSLRFEVAGYLGRPGLFLAVQPTNGGPAVAAEPVEEPRERWVVALVPCPDGPFEVVGIDLSPEFWLAFGPPVEVGPLSRWSVDLAAAGRGLLMAGLLLGLVAARAARAGVRSP
jgi:hypothetical protein